MTESLASEPLVVDGHAVSDPGRDLVKIAVVERHLGTGRVGRAFLSGSGLQAGCARVDSRSRRPQPRRGRGERRGHGVRVGRLAEVGGGIVVVDDGTVVAECPLAVAGLLSDQPLDAVVDQSRACNEAAIGLGWRGATPFLTLAFMALSVIPSLKLTDRGLVDVDGSRSCRFVPESAEELYRRALAGGRRGWPPSDPAALRVGDLPVRG